MSNAKKSPLDFLEREVDPRTISFFNSHEDMESSEFEDDEEEDEDSNIVVDDESIDDIEEDTNGKDSDDDDDTGDLGDEGDAPTITNPINILARSFIEDGILPEDTVIKNDITDQELSEIYKASKEEIWRNEIRNEIIAKEGLTNEAIAAAKQIFYGVAPESINKVKMYSTLSNFEFDDESDTFDDDMKSFLEFYYNDISFDKNLINRQIDRDLDSDIDELNLVFSAAKNHFKSKAIQVTQENADIAARTEADLAEKERIRTESINTLLDTGNIAGYQYNKSSMNKVKSALFDKTEIYRDKDGKQYRVTLYDKKRMEVANSTELSLKQMVDFILGTSTDSLKNEETLEKAKKTVLSELNKATSSIPSVSGKGKSSEASSITKYGTKAFSI